MEGLQPTVTVLKQKPPAKPPPLQEHTSDDELEQWMKDVQTNAEQKLISETTSKISWLQGGQYTPLATIQKNQNKIQHQLLLTTERNIHKYISYISQLQKRYIAHMF